MRSRKDVPAHGLGKSPASENNREEPRIACGLRPVLADGERSLATGKDRIEPAETATWFAEFAGELRAFLLGVLRNDDLAGEALQATLVKALERGHEARPETRRGWLFRVALNEALVLKRKAKVQEKSFRELAQNDARRHESAGGSVTRNESPEGFVLKAEVVERVRLALDGLPAEQRRVVRMRIYEHKTFAVIASELKLPLGTVLTRMRLATEKLRDRLAELDG
ncbi:MAG: RNA polymerase sigma-70 factor ECF subfamily [Planctomycetota bacterium]|nr:MAG: RNA polymerase sigma-70 factor ECF subfamily [Planctomycetota bacterium]